MKRGGENVVVVVFGALFLLAIFMMVSQQGIRTTGFVTSNTTSNVTISTYYAIQMSSNLSSGISFGNISSLPALFANATHNYDGVNSTPQTSINGTNGTSMWMNVSTDSNTAVDFCISANASLKNAGGDSILLPNETYYNSTQTNQSLPTLTSDTALTTSYVKAGPNVAVGGSLYYRFWLNVTAGTPSGSYVNQISFEGVATGGGC